MALRKYACDTPAVLAATTPQTHADRHLLDLRAVEVEEAQRKFIAGVVVDLDEQLATRPVRDLVVEYNAFGLRVVAGNQMADGRDAGFVLVAHRQMQDEIDIGLKAEFGEFIDGFGRRGGGFQRLDLVRDLQIRERFRATRPCTLALLHRRVRFSGCFGSVFGVGSSEQTAVGQGHLISSKYNIGFVRHGDAGNSNTPHAICGFVAASGNAAFGALGFAKARHYPNRSPRSTNGRNISSV